MPPHGAWKPSMNISSILTSLQILMAEMRSEVAAPQEAVMDAVLIKNLSRLCRQQALIRIQGKF